MKVTGEKKIWGALAGKPEGSGQLVFSYLAADYFANSRSQFSSDLRTRGKFNLIFF